MPGTRQGHRLASAWLPEEFHHAIGLVAAARGESKSELIRRVLVQEALAVREDSDENDRAEAAHP